MFLVLVGYDDDVGSGFAKADLALWILSDFSIYTRERVLWSLDLWVLVLPIPQALLADVVLVWLPEWSSWEVNKSWGLLLFINLILLPEIADDPRFK